MNETQGKIAFKNDVLPCLECKSVRQPSSMMRVIEGSRQMEMMRPLEAERGHWDENWEKLKTSRTTVRASGQAGFQFFLKIQSKILTVP